MSAESLGSDARVLEPNRFPNWIEQARRRRSRHGRCRITPSHPVLSCKS